MTDPIVYPETIKRLGGQVFRGLMEDMYVGCNYMNQHGFISIHGKPGSGKSYLSVWLAYILNPDKFTIDDVCFSPGEYVARCDNDDTKGRPIVYEEVEFNSNAKEQMKKDVLDTTKLMAMIRSKNMIHIWNCPSGGNIPSDIRDKRQASIFCRERSKRDRARPTEFKYKLLDYQHESNDFGKNKFTLARATFPRINTVVNDRYHMSKITKINKFYFHLPRDDPRFMDIIKQYEKKKKAFSDKCTHDMNKSVNKSENQLTEEEVMEIISVVDKHKDNYLYPGTNEFNTLKIKTDFGLDITRARFVITEVKKKNKKHKVKEEKIKVTKIESNKDRISQLIKEYG